ncbi:hypothetical protein G3M48_010392 [Beauveria asiatica]|uniref:Uncharacterized protein n=1 Tax=Beauveria asiatica TaxID=1069075 RepID=A0AAW0S1W2_9HYPO
MPDGTDTAELLSGLSRAAREKYLPDDAKDLSSLWTKLLALTVTLADILSTFNQAGQGQLSEQALHELEQRIRASCQPRSNASNNPVVTLHAYHLELYMESVVLVMYRPYLLESPQDTVDARTRRSMVEQRTQHAASNVNRALEKLITADMVPICHAKLANQRVLVIGGSSGIGYAVAEGAIAYGASRIVLASRAGDKLQQAATQLQLFSGGNDGVEVLSVPFAVGDIAPIDVSVAEMLRIATDNYRKPFDHIIYTAGDNHKPRALEDVTIESSIESAKLRFFAPLIIAKYIAKGEKDAQPVLLKSRKSSFLISNGFTSLFPLKGWSQEIGFHAGIDGLARVLAVDLQPIRVNSIPLGVVDTGLHEKSFPGLGQTIVDAQKQSTLIHGVPVADEVAELYLGLMRDGNTTGANVVSDGGARFATSNKP